jgi:hypothetical protein
MSLVKNRITNDHFLYVESGTATNDQLISELTKAITNYLSIFPKSCSPKFKCNIITKHDGSTYGYGYIWVEDIRLARVLLGLNTDGSQRIEEKEDELWIPDPSIQQNYSEWLQLPLLGKSWVEIAEVEEEYQRLLTRPTIKTPLPPLIQLPGFTIQKASVSEKDSNVSTHKLFCTCLPLDITEKDVREVFEPYSTSKSQRKGSHRYPEICIDTKKNSATVLVTYDPNTYDGLFAILMTKRIVIKGHTIYFDYFKTKK